MKKRLILFIAFTSVGLSAQTTAEDYFKSGNSKRKLKDYDGAIIDYSIAIELDSKYKEAYYNRGNSKKRLGDLNGACLDWKKATRLGVKRAANSVRDQCN
jgi:tetratricopeptide (TPR) repeat protein